MTDFADSLFEDLMAEHGAELAAAGTAAPAPARRRYTRPAWATAGTVAAAGAAVVGFTVFGGAASAYAVTDNHDGTVTVSVSKAGGITGANAALHKLGRVNVVAVKITPGCPSIMNYVTHDQSAAKLTARVQRAADGRDVITVKDQGAPPNETLMLAFSFDTPRQTVAAVLVKGTVPTCVSLPGLPPYGAVTGSGGGVQTHTDSDKSIGGSTPAPDQQNG